MNQLEGVVNVINPLLLTHFVIFINE